VRADKSLGQHFLTNPELLAKIAAASESGAGDVVLEIGPGPGALTTALPDTGATVVAIERDARMLSGLERQFAGRDFIVVNGDALEMDWHALVAPWVALGRRWRVVGNIPYYITSPLLEKALTAPFPASVTYWCRRKSPTASSPRPGTTITALSPSASRPWPRRTAASWSDAAPSPRRPRWTRRCSTSYRAPSRLSPATRSPPSGGW
jgi:hypothetical protein